MLEQALKADSFRAKHNRKSTKALFERIKAEGYDGGYSQLTAFIRSWRGEQGKWALCTLDVRTRRGLSVRLERRRSANRRSVSTDPGLPHEAVCQSRILVGGVSQPRPRDVVRCQYPLVWCVRWGATSRHLQQHEDRCRQGEGPHGQYSVCLNVRALFI